MRKIVLSTDEASISEEFSAAKRRRKTQKGNDTISKHSYDSMKTEGLGTRG
jgi:hypothetical protein